MNPDLSAPISGEMLRECQLYMRLAREWDSRFEKLFRTGGVAKWYSSVGNEAITVPAACCLDERDAIFTLHRDSGAVLRHYLDAGEFFPEIIPKRRRNATASSTEILHRLACQMLGKVDGFSQGFERSYHFSVFDEALGIAHVGMISHLGAMIPVAAGAALAFRHRGLGGVAINFIGDGGTSTGDFHEGLNMAAVLDAPLILIIENNGWAFSTPLSEQSREAELAKRAVGYGIPGVRVDGNDAVAMWGAVSEAVDRARAGDGPTLIEALVSRMRGHSEGDDSIEFTPAAQRDLAATSDPLARIERILVERELASEGELDVIRRCAAELMLEAIDRASRAADPDPGASRAVHAD